jgi:hypothetical protein
MQYRTLLKTPDDIDYIERNVSAGACGVEFSIDKHNFGDIETSLITIPGFPGSADKSNSVPSASESTR